MTGITIPSESMSPGQISGRLEAASDSVVRRVRVNRNRTPQEMLDATGCDQSIDHKVVGTMPRGQGKEEVEIHFFRYEGRQYMSEEDLAEEYERRGLDPADPYSLAAVNESDRVFADDHPNGTHWPGPGGFSCYIAFQRSSLGRLVQVFLYARDWIGPWWFAGVRKCIVRALELAS